MWLRDANMDVHLVPILEEFGTVASTAATLGWRDLSNAAVSHGFTVLLTRDTDFGLSAAKSLRLFVTLPQRPGPIYRESFCAEWRKAPIKPLPGRLVFWPRWLG